MLPPKISIIIPSKPKTDLNAIKKSLADLDYPKELVEVFFVSGTHPPAQKNEAIRKSFGDFIFIFDDDIDIPSQHLKKMLNHFTNSKIAVVGGPNLTPKDSSFSEKFYGCLLESPFVTGWISRRYTQCGKKRFASEKDLHGCNLCFRGDVLRKNLFPESLFPNDENELLERLRHQNYSLIFDPECFVFHKRRGTFQKAMRQIYLSGMGRGRQFSIDDHKIQNFIYFLPSFFLIYLVFLIFFHNFHYFFFPLIAYFILLFFGTLHLWMRNNYRPIALFIAPFIIAFSHFVYGIALLHGLLDSFFWQKPRNYRGEIHISHILFSSL